jgi:hypothetical protein
MWSVDDISFELLYDMTDDPVVTLLFRTPVGQLMFTGEPVEMDGVLISRGTHVQDASVNAIGAANLMVIAQALIAQALMDRMDYNELIIEGAIRATGANPGRRPRPIRFTRHVRPAPAPGPRRPLESIWDHIVI